MRTLLTRRAGEPGTKKLHAEWGDDLVCVRYRYDEAHAERLKTVEIVVERVAWDMQRERRGAAAPVHVRIEKREDLLRRAVLFAGGKWDESTNTWSLPRAAATALGLTARITRPRRRTRRSVSPLDRAHRHHR